MNSIVKIDKLIVNKAMREAEDDIKIVDVGKPIINQNDRENKNANIINNINIPNVGENSKKNGNIIDTNKINQSIINTGSEETLNANETVNANNTTDSTDNDQNLNMCKAVVINKLTVNVRNEENKNVHNKADINEPIIITNVEGSEGISNTPNSIKPIIYTNNKEKVNSYCTEKLNSPIPPKNSNENGCEAGSTNLINKIPASVSNVIKLLSDPEEVNKINKFIKEKIELEGTRASMSGINNLEIAGRLFVSIESLNTSNSPIGFNLKTEMIKLGATGLSIYNGIAASNPGLSSHAMYVIFYATLPYVLNETKQTCYIVASNRIYRLYKAIGELLFFDAISLNIPELAKISEPMFKEILASAKEQIVESRAGLPKLKIFPDLGVLLLSPPVVINYNNNDQSMKRFSDPIVVEYDHTSFHNKGPIGKKHKS